MKALPSDVEIKDVSYVRKADGTTVADIRVEGSSRNVDNLIGLAGETKKFRNLDDAFKYYLPESKERGNPTCWLKKSKARGSVHKEITAYSNRDDSVNPSQTVLTWVDKNTRWTSGHIHAFPSDDFRIEEGFEYPGQWQVVRKGLLVSVPIAICFANEYEVPTEIACQRAVEVLAESGAQVPGQYGKPGKLRALVDSATKKYGATSARVIYDGSPDQRLRILLTGVDNAKAKRKITAFTYSGENVGSRIPEFKVLSAPDEKDKRDAPVKVYNIGAGKYQSDKNGRYY